MDACFYGIAYCNGNCMGFSAVSIGNRVGHESVDITYRYAHMFPTEQTQMAKLLNEEFKEGAEE